MSSHIEKVVFPNGVEADVVHPRNGSSSLRLMFLRGMWEKNELFARWLEFCYENGITAYVPDLQPGDNVSIHDYARLVSEIVREIGPIVLVGHSMGGLIAQMVAAMNDMVQAAVFLNSVPPQGSDWARIIRYPPSLLNPKYLLAMKSGEIFRINEDHAMKYILNNMNREKANKTFLSFRTESGLVLSEIIAGVEVGPIRCPTLVVAGMHDRIQPLVVQRGIARKYGSDLLKFPVGHMIQLEDNASCRYFRQIVYWVKNHVSIQKVV